MNGIFIRIYVLANDNSVNSRKKPMKFKMGTTELRLDFQELVSEVDKYVVYQIYAETIRGYPVCKFQFMLNDRNKRNKVAAKQIVTGSA